MQALPRPQTDSFLPSQFILLCVLQNLTKERLQNVWNCEKTLTCNLSDELFRQGETVDCALKPNYLPTYLPIILLSPLLVDCSMCEGLFQTPFHLTLRLWDVYMLEGDRLLVAMAYCIMKMHRRKLFFVCVVFVFNVAHIRNL